MRIKKLPDIKLLSKYDEFTAVTSYKIPTYNMYEYSLRDLNIKFDFKLFQKQESERIFLDISYSYEDWIFADEIILLVDGSPISKRSNNNLREVNSGSVTELVRFDITADELKSIANSDQFKIRVQGKYKVDLDNLDVLKDNAEIIYDKLKSTIR